MFVTIDPVALLTFMLNHTFDRTRNIFRNTF
jgi:hypothetical protein